MSPTETQTTLDFSSEAVIARDVERLRGLAVELALRNGPRGVTVSDLRLEAERVGILTGAESGARVKQLNLGQVPKRAGLAFTGRYRRSEVEQAHGNLNAVWVHQRFAGAA